MADQVFFWLAVITLLLWVLGSVDIAVHGREVRFLREVLPEGSDAARGSLVSIVVAARNEERTLGAAAASLLRQRGVNLELILVDDRSEDATGDLFDALAEQDPRARSIHVARLPAGWIGKNHALHEGAAASGGEWILFTDADVVLGDQALSRAVGLADREGLDHIAVLPELSMPGLLTDLFAGTFAFLFARFARPWRVKRANSSSHIGIGAFNLVRAEVYHAIGGHSRIALRPDDDMMLGKLIKQAGFRQEALFGRGEVRVQWYSSIGEAVRGLEKNAYAGLGYSVGAVAGACLSLLVFGVWPFAALAVTSGAALGMNLGAVAIMLVLYVASTRTSGADPRLAPAVPLGILIFCYAVSRATLLTIVRGEIRWRGTSYSLEELRGNRV
jgi:hypothetical protein